MVVIEVVVAVVVAVVVVVVVIVEIIIIILLSSLWVSRTGSASDWCALQEALYKCIDTIQYNTIILLTQQLFQRLLQFTCW